MSVLRFRSGRTTERLEAFSDGVIAIAITLLTLDIHVPTKDESSRNGLWHELVHIWPHYLSFATSFIVVGIIWINHHGMFAHIARTDHYLALINTFFLFTIAALPFTTALVAEHLGSDEARTAILVYDGWFVLIAIAFNLLWWHARRAGLIDPQSDRAAVDLITKRFRYGLPGYTLIFIVAFISPIAAVIGTGLLAILYALPNQTKEA